MSLLRPSHNPADTLAEKFQDGAANFADDLAENLVSKGFIGMTAVGSRIAPVGVLVVAGQPGMKFFEKLMEIAPTLPEHAEMMAEVEKMVEEINKQIEKN